MHPFLPLGHIWNWPFYIKIKPHKVREQEANLQAGCLSISLLGRSQSIAHHQGSLRIRAAPARLVWDVTLLDCQTTGNGADLENNKYPFTEFQIKSLHCLRASRSFSPGCLGQGRTAFASWAGQGRDIWTFTMTRLVHSNVPIPRLRLLPFL